MANELGLRSVAFEVDDLQPRAATQVKGPTVRRGAGLFLEVEESGQIPVNAASLPRLETDEVQQLVRDRHAPTIATARVDDGSGCARPR